MYCDFARILEPRRRQMVFYLLLTAVFFLISHLADRARQRVASVLAALLGLLSLSTAVILAFQGVV